MLKYWALIMAIGTTLHAAEPKILVLSGSTREDSFNKKLAKEAASLAQQAGADVKWIDLRDYHMPFYDEDIEKKGMPEAAKQFRQLMKESQAIIIATPEYNGSVSSVLKNSLDWASRNENGEPSREAFAGKKFAIMSASPGPMGGSRAIQNLSTIIQNVGGEIVSIQVSVPDAYQAFTPDGQIKDPQIKNKLKQEVQLLFSPK